MGSALLVLLLSAAPFGLGALLLWWMEMRRKRAKREPLTWEALGFLVRDLGFSGPVMEMVSREYTETYSKGAIEVHAFSDGAFLVGVRVGGRSATLWHLDLQAAADLLRAHPEILQGDFSAVPPLHPDGPTRTRSRRTSR